MPRRLDTTSLRILYVGDFWDGATSRARFEALRNLGHQVEPVATDPPPLPFHRRMLSRLAFTAGYPLDSSRAGRRILAAVRSRPWDLLWVDEIKSMDRDMLDAIHRLQPALVRLAFIMDDPFSSRARGWRRFRRAIRSYDVHCVPRQASVPELEQRGAQCVLRYHKGYDPRLHRPVPVPADIPRMPVFFAGHWEPKREADLAALVQAGLPLHLAGYRDWRKGRFWQVLQPYFHEGGYFGERYTQALCASDIALCFYSQWNRDTENSRMYEIPACGTFMLAERNSENVRIFEEGNEADFFGDADELVRKLTHYLHDLAARRSIADAGRRRCQSSGYGYPDRLRQLILRLIELSQTPSSVT